MKPIILRQILPILISIFPSPLFAVPGDIDNDGLRDEVETNTGIFVSASNTGSNPNLADTDGDSMPDGMELRLGTNPNLSTSKVQRPNIIYIVADDLGYGDVGCFWQNQRTGTMKFATPGLDAMAAEGAMLTNHYAGAPICASSRSSFLQGRSQGHADIRDLQFDFPLPQNHNIANVLKSAGYRTIHIGKAGLAGTDPNNPTAHPLSRGFDRFFGYLLHGQAHEHYPRNGTTAKGAKICNDYQFITDAYQDVYTSDVFTAFAKKNMIDETVNHPERPFFMYLAYDTPHFDDQYAPTATYPTGSGVTGGLQWTGSPSYVNTAINDPNRVNNVTNRHPSINPSWGGDSQPYVSMVRRLDESVADILQTLRDLGIDQNTLVVFTSDNGSEPIGIYPPNFQGYAGFEGIKGDLWEGGIRSPTIVRWPGHIPATNSLSNIRKINRPCANYDWLATFSELAKVPAPAFSDGTSLTPTLTGEGSQKSTEFLYFEINMYGSTPTYGDFINHGGEARNQMQAIRMGDFMGVRTSITNAGDPFRIYNVVTDPKESINLAAIRPDLQARMKDLSISARRPLSSVPRLYDTALLPAVSPSSVTTGIECKSYEGYWPWLPDFSSMTETTKSMVTTISPAGRSRNEDVGLAFNGYISVPTSGAYEFTSESNSSTCLWIHESRVIDNDFNFTTTRASGKVYLSAGLHPIRLYYRHQAGTASLELKYSGPNIPLQPIPASAYFNDGPPPVFALQPDSAVTSAGNPVLIDALANDTCNYPLSLASVGPSGSGTASINAGKILYTPAGGFLGTATFPYSVSGGAGTASSAVSADVLFNDEIWIPMNEGSGTVVRAVSQTSLDSGTLAGTTGTTGSWIYGKSGTCLSFDGLDDEVDFPGMVLPLGKNPRSFTFWVRSSAMVTNKYQTIFSYGGNSSTGQRLTIRLDNVPGTTNPHRLRLEVNGGVVVGTRVINDGSWHHLAVVLSDQNNNGAINTNEALLYVDGAPDPITQITPRSISTVAGYTPTLGGSSHASDYNFMGDIDEVRIFPRALSADEVASLGAATASLPPDIVDSDGDGTSDLQEFIAGTNPNDGNDRFRIQTFTLSSSDTVLQWSGVAGRTYRVEESRALLAWSLVPGVAPIVMTSTTPNASVTVPKNGATQRFLRMQVMLTP